MMEETSSLLSHHQNHHRSERLPFHKRLYRLTTKGIYEYEDYQNTPTATGFNLIILIVIAIASILCGVAGAIASAYQNEDSLTKWNGWHWSSQFFSIMPIFALQFFLGVPRARYYFIQLHERHWRHNSLLEALPMSIVITWCWLLSSLVLNIGSVKEHSFDPLAFGYVFFICLSVLGMSLSQKEWLRRVQLDISEQSEEEGLTFNDLVVWLMLFMMIDLRWYDKGLWHGLNSMGYDWWAAASTLLMLVSFNCFRQLRGFGYRLIPNIRDICIVIGGLILILIIVLPIGIGVGFLKKPDGHASVPDILSGWLENFLTVALTEETFFRAVLMNGLRQRLEKTNKTSGKWLALLFSSMAFGLMHWVRMSQLADRIAYVIFAFICGMVYGTGYMLSGNNILASALIHSITDTIWAAAFHK